MAPSSRFHAPLLAILLLGGVASCGEAAGEGERESAPPATEPAEIHRWLAEGHYRDWASDPEPLPGLNGTTRRVFLNELADRGGSPVGAAGVRELFNAESGEQLGWSMLIKTSDGPDPAQNWYFYETYELDDATPFATARHAAPGCVNCHSDAPDVIQTSRLDLVR